MGQMGFHRGPLAGNDAVDAGIAQYAIGADLMVAQYPVQFCSQPFNGVTAFVVEEMRAKLDGNTA